MVSSLVRRTEAHTPQDPPLRPTHSCAHGLENTLLGIWSWGINAVQCEYLMIGRISHAGREACDMPA
jgi:hypothetical protein